jgi:hypothetical protein
MEIELQDGTIRHIKGFGHIQIIHGHDEYDPSIHMLIASEVYRITDLWPDNKQR